ncbi:conserved hypothetical protein [Coccidioides posadasii str. Silveira]|uniref:Uncharacterized protein n=2 Tax=Coccidioides posadasii TaxID=199306 RepID=E9CZR3_COCPS|nr:conserved hypothetical protein [Coccidioides posadasii str. Silveira]KMM73269.1 hypothetical protein CPAG_09558 [Coccidioides posadasii RMSCC 3488]
MRMCCIWDRSNCFLSYARWQRRNWPTTTNNKVNCPRKFARRDKPEFLICAGTWRLDGYQVQPTPKFTTPSLPTEGYRIVSGLRARYLPVHGLPAGTSPENPSRKVLCCHRSIQLHFSQPPPPPPCGLDQAESRSDRTSG